MLEGSSTTEGGETEEWTPDFLAYCKSCGGPQKGLDLSHPYSGSGMQYPSKAYQVFLRSAVKSAIWVSTPFRSATGDTASKRLRGAKNMMRTATKSIGKPSFRAFRQPFLAIMSPV